MVPPLWSLAGLISVGWAGPHTRDDLKDIARYDLADGRFTDYSAR
jgi:hypothetical protein